MMQTISLAVYRLMLYLYPADFRRDYGDMMQFVFEEACIAAGNNGLQGWLKLWRRTTIDLTQSIYREFKATLMTQKIHGYEVNATPGTGASATIYRAYDPALIAQVALKVFDKKASDQALLPHFKREATVHQQLNHPNIPHCYGVKESDDSICIVMQYINGKTLLEIMEERNTPFSVQQVIEWALIACDVLSYLHNENLIYRDMKPGNLMLTADNDLYVIDYGITVFGDGDGIAIGTEGYAPPEQYKGKISRKSDIYSLGATLHQLLTNRDPRHHEAHTFQEAPPSSYNPDVSEALETILMKALDNNPDNRFETIDEMKQALLSV